MHVTHKWLPVFLLSQEQKLGTLPHKGLDRKCFLLYRLYIFCHNSSSLLLQSKSIHRPKKKKKHSCVPIKHDFTNRLGITEQLITGLACMRLWGPRFDCSAFQRKKWNKVKQPNNSKNKQAWAKITLQASAWTLMLVTPYRSRRYNQLIFNLC